MNCLAVAEVSCWLHLVDVTELEASLAFPVPLFLDVPHPVIQLVQWAAGAWEPTKRRMPPPPKQNFQP